MKKRCLLFIPLVLLTLSSCQKNSEIESSSSNSHEETSKLSYDKIVDNVENRGFVTGENAPGVTTDFDVGGTDLGYPLYIKEINKTYYFFGDTFSRGQTGNWRSNVIGISEDDNLDDGLTLSSFVSNSAGYTTYAINGHHDNNGFNEVTKIPTGVIDIDGTIYMYYFSMFDWNIDHDKMMNYGGCIKSSDYGETWERIYDLTWVNPESNNSKENLQKLINEDADNIPNKGNINVDDYLAFDMTQICPVDGKDGYIYLFLEGGYRNHGLKLARVKKENIEQYEEYEYFINKFDDKGEPLFRKGRQGIAYLTGKSATQIISRSFGEMTAFYNNYLKKWCVMSETGNAMLMFTSDKIYGPYDKTHTIFPGSSPVVPASSIYAPLSAESMLEEDGKVMYMLASTWVPYYNPSLIKVTFK